jgi:hypothetical protein
MRQLDLNGLVAGVAVEGVLNFAFSDTGKPTSEHGIVTVNFSPFRRKKVTWLEPGTSLVTEFTTYIV